MKNFILILTLILAGCASPFQQTVNEYVSAAQNIDLGMDKQEVISILSPSQKRLRNTEKKHPDHYIKDGVNVEIIYFRSGWQSDGLTTDDEFTPYLFNNGKLVAIGWATLGGAKSQGQATPTTNINVSNKTIIY